MSSENKDLKDRVNRVKEILNEHDIQLSVLNAWHASSAPPIRFIYKGEIILDDETQFDNSGDYDIDYY